MEQPSAEQVPPEPQEEEPAEPQAFAEETEAFAAEEPQAFGAESDAFAAEPEGFAESHFEPEPEPEPEPESTFSQGAYMSPQPSRSVMEDEAHSFAMQDTPAMPAQQQPQRRVGEGDSQLLSSDSGNAVHGAFSALAHTILAQNARTLEDLVAEMLQPMLKGWLDENLPSLVERLVQEEIQRVSRGR
jgi:hypothetical protein